MVTWPGWGLALVVGSVTNSGSRIACENLHPNQTATNRIASRRVKPSHKHSKTVCKFLGTYSKCEVFFCLKYLITICFNTLTPVYASVNRTTLIEIMACHLSGTKPLSEPILDYCQLNPWEKFESKHCNFHSRKCDWKCRLQNVSILSRCQCVDFIAYHFLTLQDPVLCIRVLIARFMGPTCRPQMGPMLAPWTLLSEGVLIHVPCYLKIKASGPFY